MSNGGTKVLNLNLSTFHYGSIKIVVNRSIVVKNNRSTFHYGSIKISARSFKQELDNLSTFHYGSIKIYQLIMIHIVKFNLHSTMVLLK